jgi:two-component sensor histidine kinase
MQIINSLLKLQSNNIEDEQTKEILKDSQSRVYAMSAVHETLHGSENLSEIDLKTYLHKVTLSVFQAYSTKLDKVKLNTSIEKMPISINQASPIGLIINELISNSLKYGFPEERTGEITVSMKKLDNELELTFMDDGIGIPDGMDWKNSKSLGLKLVRTLVENQLDGSIDMDSNNGTKFIIKFNIET